MLEDQVTNSWFFSLGFKLLDIFFIITLIGQMFYTPNPKKIVHIKSEKSENYSL